jgi:hypothetical protein
MGAEGVSRLEGTATAGLAAPRARPLSTGREQVMDGAFVAVVAALPALFFTRGLGFYLDDHLFLGMMSVSHDQSVGGLFSALNADPKAQLRPVEYFLIAVAYKLFGTSHLPYHIALAALVPMCAVALYAVLVRLRVPRYLAVATPVLFASAPHYSSARVWPDAFSPTLTFTLALVSLYAGLAAAEAKGHRAWLWLAGACIAMLTSIFMYEITLPLFAAAALYHCLRARHDAGRWRYTAAGLTSVLAGALLVKLVAARSVGRETSYSVGFDDGFIHHMGYLVSGSVKVNFGTYGVGLPYVLSWITLNRLTWSAVAAGGLVGAAVFSYFARRAFVSEVAESLPEWRGRPAWQYLAAAGLAVVFVGYGLFVTGANIYFTSAGMDNRVNIIPALGMALIALALILRALQLFSAERRPTLFAFAVALLAAVGIFITTTIASYWQEAADRQRDVLSGLRAALPEHPAPMTILLDGSCPEVGPGIVFDVHYDLGGALQTIYRDRALQGVEMPSVVSLESRGIVLTTHVYNLVGSRLYPYDRRLVVFDSRRRKLYSLANFRQAQAYFASRQPLNCPPLRSFAWGLKTSRYLPFN